MRYRLYSDRNLAQAQADALWERYAAEQRVARGLAPGASLDTRAGVPVEPPITVRYCEPLEVAGETRVALPVDAFALAQQGRLVQVAGRGEVALDVSGHVDESELPQRFRERLAPEMEGRVIDGGLERTP